MADDLLFHRMADIAVRAVLQIAVRGGITLKRQQCALRAVCKAALSAELVECPANKQMVAVVEQNRLTVGQALAALQRRDGRALGHLGQRHNAGRGPVRLDFFVDGKVADMLLEHHKREVRAVHELLHAARRPVKERLSVNFDQRLRADKAVFKKPAAPAGHGENQVKFRHDVPLFKKPSPAGEGGAQRRMRGDLPLLPVQFSAEELLHSLCPHQSPAATASPRRGSLFTFPVPPASASRPQ